jgi:Zn-dependent M28 family amino/carboxypeptidase
MREFLEEAEVFNAENVLEYISEIAKFHRIQGSKELVEAAKYILEELRVNGIKAGLFEDVYDGERWHLTLVSPIAWDLIHGEVEIVGKRITTSKTPLLVMAHSPPGKAEGEVVAIEREEDWENAKGKIVLVGEKWHENYKKANEKGALAFIAYRKGTGKAFPYIGLFLAKNDLEWAKIPAVALSEELANTVIGKLKKCEKVTAKIKVETLISDSQALPIVYATVGKPPYVLFVAHICHPRPGANDNASGAAMLIELAKVLNNLYNDSFRFGFAFLWIPEHYGTQAFIEKYAKLDDYYVAINLDMVGGSEDRANSTIMIIRTPLSRFSIVSGILEYYLNLANSGGESFGGSPLPKLKIRSYPYELGSDHDVFNFFGIPSVMPITWPDRFYHSSEDSVEKISKESLEIIGKAVLATALALAKAKKEELERFAKGFTMKYLGELSIERDLEVAEKLVMLGLSRDSEFLGLNIGHKFTFEPWLKWNKKGIIYPRSVKQIDEKKGAELEKILEDKKMSILLHELLMLGEIMPKGEAFKALEEEYGQFEKEKLEKAVEILRSLGIVVF